MLGVKQYSPEYIAACRKKVQTDMTAFHQLAEVSKDFETLFFCNLVLVLELMFMHRMRGQEGKDGNPLNEVRMLASSILTNNNILEADSTIKYDPVKSVLGNKIGDRITIDAADFDALAHAYFLEIELKYAV